MVKVSVIVPVYNVEKYLSKCLDSLVNQTLDDIEIIVVNDGTKDNSEKIILEYQKKYSNIKYYKKTNGGLSDARNYGLKYVMGEYVAFLDSDDYVEKTMYEEMYTKAKKEDLDMVEADFYWVYGQKKILDQSAIVNQNDQIFPLIRVVAWNKLIKTKIIKDNHILFPKGLRYEDVVFTYILLNYVKKVGTILKPFVNYVQREASISNTQNERVGEIYTCLRLVKDFYEDKKEYQSKIEYLYIKYILGSSYLRAIEIKDKKLRKQILEQGWIILNSYYPNWKKNYYLHNIKSNKHRYYLLLNKFIYMNFSFIFRIRNKVVK